jgi:hypothetical protein
VFTSKDLIDVKLLCFVISPVTVNMRTVAKRTGRQAPLKRIFWKSPHPPTDSYLGENDQ